MAEQISAFLRSALLEEMHLLMTQLRGEITAELRAMHRQELTNLSLQLKQVIQEAHSSVSSVRAKPRRSVQSSLAREFETDSTASNDSKALMPSSSFDSVERSPDKEGGARSECKEILLETAAACCPSQSMLKLVVHDLKAPLNGLAGYSRTLAETDPKRQKEFRMLTNTAQFALDNVTNLTDLWTYAKQQSRDLVADAVRLEDLNTLTHERLERAVNRKGKPLVQSGVEVVMTVQDTQYALHGDYGALCTLQYHLASNAAKFTQKGQVKVVWQCRDEGLCLAVEDTGSGCSSELLEQIFEPFVVEESTALGWLWV
ncbi:Autoinducer 2 sensor kinase/phosphatase LuxQ [Durusdinium trenchii]|uniref:histidine kinase n=1 Tax=Durusdinium trenchii TaxID=1381693 RepID=A0ABP0PIR2_9DINO